MNSLIEVPALKMVAAGGGARVMESDQAPMILREALDISGAEKPTVLTISTAEPTKQWHDEFVAHTQRQFGSLGARVINLHDFGTMPSAAEVEDKIANADTIWVAGGNTKEMIKTWGKHDITNELHKAAARGAVMSGGSAGMLAWLAQGHSDSISYEVPKGDPWDYIFVKGLGYVNVTGTPHFDNIEDSGVVRSNDFKEKFAANPTLPTTGIGIDTLAALSIVDGTYRVRRITGDEKFPRAQVHVIKKTEDGLSEDILPAGDDYKPFDL